MRGAHRKLLWIGAVVLGTVALLLVVGAIRAGSVDAWVGRELSAIVNRYLVPRLHIGKVSYWGGKTVYLQDVSLDADDPEQSGKTVRIFEVKKARLELAEMPAWGKRLKIREAYLDCPIVRFIKPGPGQKLIGFADFLRKNAVASQPASTNPADKNQEKANSTDQARPSDAFEIRYLKFSDGIIEYNERHSGTDQLRLDSINSEIHVSPEKEGWYGVQMAAGRDPIFNLDAKGRLNVNDLQVEIAELASKLDLNKENQHYLPQVMQKLVDDYQIEGKLELSAKGKLPLLKPSTSDLEMGVNLTKANVAIGGYVMPVESFIGDVHMHDNVAQFKTVTAKALGGTLEFRGVVPFDPKDPLQLYVTAKEIHLARTLRTFSNSTEKPTVAGLVDGEIQFIATRGQWRTSSRGNGKLFLHHGHIPDLPVLGEIVRTVTVLSKFGTKDGKWQDEAQMDFDFDGPVMRVKELKGAADAMAFRAEGNIYLDGRLDLRMNAGPLEKLEANTGVVGDAFASMTGQLMGYRVTGNLRKPEVAVEMGGK